MKYFTGVSLLLLMVVLPFGLHRTNNVYAAEERSSAGWEKGSEYNNHYHAEQDTVIKGTMVKFIEITPMKSMSPGIAMILISRDNEKVTVHLGPKWFVDLLVRGFKPGDGVKVKGVWAQIKGERFFMASKVRNGELFEVKFRKTKDGTPYWTMTPEEIINSDERLED